MIWVTDHRGITTYICEDWHRLTGQPPDESLGFGWLEAVHPEDRSLVSDGFADACKQRTEFILRYRLRRSDGTYIWVIDAATPSFTPISHDFIGYLGLVIQYDRDAQNLSAKAEVGSFKPGKTMSDFLPASKLDIIADHLIMAKAASVGCDPEVMKAIDDALHAAGRALVAETQNNTRPGSMH